MRWNTGAHPHTDKHGVGKHGFQNGNPATGTPASIDDALVYDDVFANVAHLCDTQGFMTPGRKEDLADAVAAAAAAATSQGPGTIVATMRAAPLGRELACNGAAVSRTTYAALYAVIGTTFGVGDGATTFNVPDLRGEFLRGLDAGRGIDVGRTLGSAQASQNAAHSHYNGIADNGTTNFVYGGTAADMPGSSSVTIAPEALGQNFQGITSTTGGGEARPRNVATNFFIRY